MEYSHTLIEKLFSFFDYDKEKAVVRPHILWLGILLAFALSLILVLWFGLSVFFQVENAAFFKQEGAPARVPRTEVNEAKLAETTQKYEERRETQDERLNAWPYREDPSL